MYFCNYGLRKPWQDKCLKSSVYEDPSKSNVVNGAKHSSNINHSTIGIFIHQCEVYRIGKVSLSKILKLNCLHRDQQIWYK